MIKKRSKISLITLSKSQGGANIAASRISNILNKSFNVETFYPEKKNLFGLFKYYFARLIIKNCVNVPPSHPSFHQGD